MERLLFTLADSADAPTPLPVWRKVYAELTCPGMTLMTGCEEYRAEHIEDDGYSRFCELYGKWRQRLLPTMRQTYVAGEKQFVDWAGRTPPTIDAMSGELLEAPLFVAAVGASRCPPPSR